MINKEDKADVKRVMGSKMASKVAKATDDSKSKALKKYKGYSDKFPGNKPTFYSKELAKINARSLDYYRTKK